MTERKFCNRIQILHKSNCNTLFLCVTTDRSIGRYFTLYILFIYNYTQLTTCPRRLCVGGTIFNCLLLTYYFTYAIILFVGQCSFSVTARQDTLLLKPGSSIRSMLYLLNILLWLDIKGSDSLQTIQYFSDDNN